MMIKKIKTLKEKYGIETGFFESGLPYTKLGNRSNILVDLEALSFKHEPVSNFMINQFIKSHRLLAEKYTVFLIGRKPNLPQNYSMEKMAEDYAVTIKKELGKPVDVMGISTGGQIAQYLAAYHPDTVRKLVIISAAYRLSKKGIELEKLSEEFFMQNKYGKSLAVMMDFIQPPGFKRNIAKFCIRLIGKKLLGKIDYPNDFISEIKADREMNFLDKLNIIRVPTLILCGEDDIAYTVEDVRITAEGIPDSKLLLYKGYGHNLSFSNTEQVQKDILEFLEK